MCAGILITQNTIYNKRYSPHEYAVVGEQLGGGPSPEQRNLWKSRDTDEKILLYHSQSATDEWYANTKNAVNDNVFSRL